MNKLKPYFSGFHYGIKHFNTLEDKHFQTYFKDIDKSGYYRKGIKHARNYILYRYELLTLLVVLSTIFIFIITS